MKRNFLFFLIMIFGITSRAQSITPNQTKKKIGDTATVCGMIKSSHFSSQANGHPTYLCYGGNYPAQIFTAVIFENDLGKFAYNPVDLKGDTVCVTGKIQLFEGKPAIIVTQTSQINDLSSR